MSTTQRSESMHAFFDGYVNRQTSLSQFVAQYDNALQDKAEKEFEADFRSFSSKIECASNSPIERQFQSAYTHAKFLEARSEFARKGDCIPHVVHEEGDVKTFNVREVVMVGDVCKEATFEVVHARDVGGANCTCMLFEFRGIVCRHVLAVLFWEGVHQIPSRYILRRWRKDVRWKHTYMKTSYDIVQRKPQLQRFEDMVKQFDGIAEVAADHQDSFSHVTHSLTRLRDEVEEMTRYREPWTITESVGQSSGYKGKVLSPVKVARKGRPCSKRKTSIVERLARRFKQRRESMQ